MPGWSLPHDAYGRVRRLDCAPAASVATPVRIGVGVARTFVVAIRSGVELCAVAGLGDHRLRQYRCCDDARSENGCSKELEGRHWLCSLRVSIETTQRRSTAFSGGAIAPSGTFHNLNRNAEVDEPRL